MLYFILPIYGLIVLFFFETFGRINSYFPLINPAILAMLYFAVMEDGSRTGPHHDTLHFLAASGFLTILSHIIVWVPIAHYTISLVDWYQDKKLESA